MQVRTVRVGDIDMCVAEAGAGGRPLLLLHGFTGAKEDFTFEHGWVDRLASHGWHAVAPDHRGHGDSSQPDEEAAYSFEIFARDALGLADELGWPSFALLGHSMGGMIAQVLVGLAPSRVTALVLMDTSHQAMRGVSPEQAAKAGEIAKAKGMRFLTQLEKERGGALDTPASRRLKAANPAYDAFSDRKKEVSSPAMYAAMLSAITTADDRLPALAAVDVPTLVLVGEQDAPFIKASERMAAAIPAARLEVIAGAGHSPQFEAPEAWWTALSGFLEEVE